MSLFFSTGLLLRTVATTIDPYAAVVTGISGLTGYWRLGDASTTVLADASGNGHNGSYSGTPAFGAAALTEEWQASDGKAANFAGNGYGSVLHNTAFALAQGALSFWTQANSLIANREFVTKGTGFRVRVLNNGTLEATLGTTAIGTAPSVIIAGQSHHVAVTWSQKTVRLWLDGRQVAKSEAHTTGLTGNSSDWRFGATSGGTAQDVRLDEIALYSQALLFDDIQKLSQHVGGLYYRDEDAVRTVNVSTASDLTNALSSAQPGDHIVLANGTYSGSFTAAVNGTKANPIVIRSANGNTYCTIAGVFTLNGNRTILDGVTFSGSGGVDITGAWCRATRCRAVNFTGAFAGRVSAGARFARIDHCQFGPPAADSGGGSFTNQPVRIRVDGTGPAQIALYSLTDHCDLKGTATELGNGRDVWAPGNTSAGDSYATLHRSILDQSPYDEGISLKSSTAFVQYCTFKAMTYVQNRHGADCEWRSNYYHGCEHNSFGANHWHIGNTYDGSAQKLCLPPGDVDQATFEVSGGARPACQNNRIIGCTFLNGSKIDAGNPNWNTGVNASGATAEGCTGFSVTYTAHYTGTITHTATTSEPFDVAVLLSASDVGLAAADPMVPPGWK